MAEEKQYRDAGDGQYVSKAEAEANPDTTVAETRDLHWEQPQANLGLAKTIDLLEELTARAKMAQANGETWPNYTTVESD